MSEVKTAKKEVEGIYSVDDALEILHPLLSEAIKNMNPFDQQAAIASLEKVIGGARSVGYDEGLEKGYLHSADDDLRNILDDEGEK